MHHITLLHAVLVETEAFPIVLVQLDNAFFNADQDQHSEMERATDLGASSRSVIVSEMFKTVSGNFCSMHSQD